MTLETTEKFYSQMIGKNTIDRAEFVQKDGRIDAATSRAGNPKAIDLQRKLATVLDKQSGVLPRSSGLKTCARHKVFGGAHSVHGHARTGGLKKKREKQIAAHMAFLAKLARSSEEAELPLATCRKRPLFGDLVKRRLSQSRWTAYWTGARY